MRSKLGEGILCSSSRLDVSTDIREGPIQGVCQERFCIFGIECMKVTLLKYILGKRKEDLSQLCTNEVKTAFK